MITRSISEARRELGRLIEQARQGQDVVIIKDSRPVAALRPIDDTDLDLAPDFTDAQYKRLVDWDRKQPGKMFSSPEAAVKYLKAEFRKKR
jgi:prevent-host-death family protein